MRLHRPSWLRLPSPALAVATLALVVSMSGVSYAAATLAKHSVGHAQLKKGAVTSVKVKDGSLRARDFARGQLPRGKPGAKGVPGVAGPRGAAGAEGVSGYEVVIDLVDIAPGQQEVDHTVNCPSGKVAMGGGFRTTTDNYSWDMYESSPDGNGWHSRADIKTGRGEMSPLNFYAVCVTAR